MTTSGTTTFNYNRDQIIRAALRKLGAFQSGELPDNQTIIDCSDALNAMVKEWDAIGIHIWTESEAILFLQAGQVQYGLGGTTTDHATKTNPPNFVATNLIANATSGVTSINVQSSVNILSGDNIGIVMDDGGIFWTTVSGTPFGSAVMLTNPTPDSSTLGNSVFDYTLPILRPLRIPFARRFNWLSSIDVPMVKLSRADYRDLPNKTNSGIPTTYFYDAQLNTGLMYIWPAPSDPTNAMKFTWYRQIQDFNSAQDTPDLPQEWISTLIWGLACEMAPEYGISPQKYQMLKSQLTEKLERLQGWDREEESVYFGPSLDYPMGRW